MDKKDHVEKHETSYVLFVCMVERLLVKIETYSSAKYLGFISSLRVDSAYMAMSNRISPLIRFEDIKSIIVLHMSNETAENDKTLH